MIEGKECSHPGPKIVTACGVLRIPQLGHQFVPALRNIPIVDADFKGTLRESVPGQRGYDDIEIREHRQHIDIVEETAGPAMREDEWHSPAGCRPLAYEVDS